MSPRLEPQTTGNNNMTRFSPAMILSAVSQLTWCTVLTCCTVTPVHAQDSSLYQESVPATLQRSSCTFQAVPPPKEIKIYDTVIVRVDELARMQSDGSLQRRKDALYDAVLKDWVNLIGLKALKPDKQTNGDQRVRDQLQQLFRAEGEKETRESLAFNIACTVADIRPNGNMVLEGHKRIQINDESWEVSLSGICRRQDIGPDNIVLSQNIVNLKINKRERGAVRDGYRRGWLTRLMDEFQPF